MQEGKVESRKQSVCPSGPYGRWLMEEVVLGFRLHLSKGDAVPSYDQYVYILYKLPLISKFS